MPTPPETSHTVSKVLVFDHELDNEEIIRSFCATQRLIPVKSCSKSVLKVLSSNVDLGAIFLSTGSSDSGLSGRQLGQKIHELRPEIPIFLRLSDGEKQEKEHCAFCAYYTPSTIETLTPLIDEYIFCREYPNALIRGIEEITCNTLSQFFDDVKLSISAPYLVRDRIIFGELFSLIPIESDWCRGYMMLQSEDENVRELVKAEKISAQHENHDNFRLVNDVLSEITNVAWGAMRNRFVSHEQPTNHSNTQVPIIVNHKNRYITFGTDTPQLCFKHDIERGDGKNFTLFFKFIFNLHWDPDKFSENEPSIGELVNSGELEFF